MGPTQDCTASGVAASRPHPDQRCSPSDGAGLGLPPMPVGGRRPGPGALGFDAVRRRRRSPPSGVPQARFAQCPGTGPAGTAVLVHWAPSPACCRPPRRSERGRQPARPGSSSRRRPGPATRRRDRQGACPAGGSSSPAASSRRCSTAPSRRPRQPSRHRAQLEPWRPLGRRGRCRRDPCRLRLRGADRRSEVRRAECG